MGHESPEDVLRFWIDEVGPEGWYKADAGLDEAIRARFLPTWEVAATGGLEAWRCGPRRSLAYLILTDQFPRNMFRDDDRAFSTDGRARAVAAMARQKGWDLRVDEPQRQFFYLPLMHSEILEDQERGLRLILMRLHGPGGASNLLHARAHRDVIRRFGRFPHRNGALGRTTTRPEQDFLDAGGYGGVVRELQAAA